MKILVPTDFSENAEHALTFAKNIAKSQHGTITLIFAFYAVYDFANQAEIIIDQIEQDAKKLMEKAVNQGVSEGIEMNYFIKQGTVSYVVTSTALKENYDLIVMGTQGANYTPKKIFGTNTGHVIKESKVAVLAIPEHSTWESVSKIIISSEMKEEDEVYYQKLLHLTQNWDFNYELLHIIKDNETQSQTLKDKQVAFFKEQVSKKFIEFNEIHSSLVNQAISSYLKENSDAILVMFYKKKSFFDQLINKSHSIAISHDLISPLLILH
jgi:nucleotide-binding universal stress UspA family protein